MENGQIYCRGEQWCECAIAQRLSADTWVLLSEPVLAEHHGGTCMVAAVPGTDGKVFYTKAELQERLEQEGWQYTRARLVVEEATVCDGTAGYFA